MKVLEDIQRDLDYILEHMVTKDDLYRAGISMIIFMIFMMVGIRLLI